MPLTDRRPRVNYHPTYEQTLGRAAVALAEAAGLFLDPWQQDSLNIMLAVRADGKWLCFECAEIVARQNGKGSILEARVLAGFVLFGERLILWSAHEYKTAIELFLRLKLLIRNLIEAGELDEDDIKVIHGSGEQGFERLSTGQRIKFVARSKDSGRGFSGDLVVIDEAYAYTLAQQSALMPTMSARPNPQIVYASSPPLDADSGEVLWSLRKRGDRTAPRMPEDDPWTPDPALSWRDWGIAGSLDRIDEIDLSDRSLWLMANPALPTRITEEFVAREFRSMGRLEFARERLGIWPPAAGTAGSLLDPALWQTMLDPESRRASAVALAVDITPMRDHASIGMYGPRDDGLEHMQLVDYRPGTDWIVDRLVELRDALDPICIVLDSKNGAAALVPELAERGIAVPEDPEQPRRGNLLILDTSEVAVATGQFIDGFRSHPSSYRHIGQQPLDAAIRNVKARQIGDAGQIAWGRRISEVDIGPVQVVTEARYGYHAWHQLVTGEYDLLDSVW